MIIKNLMVSLVMLNSVAAMGNSGVRLSCHFRENVLISRFRYHLSTMLWGDNFEVASGSLKGRTNSGLRFEVTAFRNGDDLVYLVDKKQYQFFYGGKPPADRCEIIERVSYPVTSLPYHSAR
ncbi:hypothetical protein PGO16_07880 [Klebsiella aerogenes]